MVGPTKISFPSILPHHDRNPVTNLVFFLFPLVPSSARRLSSSSHQAVAAPISPTELKAPANLHGFTLEREEYVAEYDAKVFLFKHEKTGAEVMSLSNDDENKTFGVTFRTPPANSTGIPHILEHSVLCGSRKYPIKEPFVELIKVGRDEAALTRHFFIFFFCFFFSHHRGTYHRINHGECTPVEPQVERFTPKTNR